MQETLRVHPVGFMGARQAIEDEVIPLSQPLKLPDGRTITEIPVSKGQNIWINIPGYNRLSSIFGEDPHEFNIDRWLDNSLGDPPGLVGIYSNLSSFGHGPHGCIGKRLPIGSLYDMCLPSAGWRFAIYEIQTIIIELLANFEFHLPKNYRGVRRTGAATMIPTVPGDRGAGTRLDLEVSILPDWNHRE
jgi:cytochrome P450